MMPMPKEKPVASSIPPKEPSAALTIPLQSEETVEQALQRARDAMYYRRELLNLIAATIAPKDIQIYGDPPDEHPYFNGRACRLVLNAAEIAMTDTVLIKDRYEGSHGTVIDFEYWVTLVTKNGRIIRTMGNCATDDEFYAKRYRWVCPNCQALTHYAKPKPKCSKCGPVDAVKEAYWLPYEEVAPDVKQKAMTNMWNHALRDLALMPSLDELKKAGMDTAKLKRVRFGDAKDSGAAPERSGATEPPRKANPTAPKEANPTAAPQTQTGVTSGTGGEKTASSQPKVNPKLPPKQGDPTPRPSQPAKAILPKRIESVRAAVAQNGDSKGNIYLRIVQEGRTLFCFDNRKMGEDERLFDILKDSEGQDAQLLITEQVRKSDGKKFLAVVGALRIGDREWEADGTPVLRRERYQSEDADVPF